MNYDDVSQIIHFHFFKKWAQWDQARPLLPWVNRVITHQTQNVVRNTYTSYSKPCNKCEANEEKYGGGEETCRVYGKQCADCPLFAKWEKSKKNAQYINLAESFDEHEEYIKVLQDDSSKLVSCYNNLHKLHDNILPLLTPIQKKVYTYLYIENKDELEVAKLMGYRTREASRSPGYKQIEKFKKIFICHAKKFIKEEML